MTPFYCKPPERAMVDYFLDVMARTELPVMIYHIPGRAGVRLTVDTIAAIRDHAPNFAGLKNTDESTGLVTAIFNRFPDMKIFSGMEPPTLAMLALGVSGAMISVANVISRNEHHLPMAPLTPELEKRLDGVLERAGLLSY
ncbi:dihydrodipicolinate synthase family protein [Hoeflea sp. WL0058]|uniref:Dihydrodipicolinate synthase family protein n=1 Tax=Flavimaribacter sediminis TaxID=2865987 RepID=A0AAE2ZT03_9HYPH|nr:dihydrodipicolinate synthase family protein [Flavimaribacter sediminis]